MAFLTSCMGVLVLRVNIGIVADQEAQCILVALGSGGVMHVLQS